jgi:NAD-dependent dihydropyrimidine dehydrogenase PreA subunit
MAYVITRLCTRAGDCVEVCPVECIVPGPTGNPDWPIFYIDPNSCIDCGACVAACPADAIFVEAEVPQEYAVDIDANRRFFDAGPGYWAFDLGKERTPVTVKR